MQQQRIEYIDIAKAIGIILVILGHCHFVGTFHSVSFLRETNDAVLVMKDDLNMASCRYDEGVVRIPISIITTIATLCACKQINKKRDIT